jgi:hypothetical protein
MLIYNSMPDRQEFVCPELRLQPLDPRATRTTSESKTFSHARIRSLRLLILNKVIRISRYVQTDFGNCQGKVECPLPGKPNHESTNPSHPQYTALSRINPTSQDKPVAPGSSGTVHPSAGLHGELSKRRFTATGFPGSPVVGESTLNRSATTVKPIRN